MAQVPRQASSLHAAQVGVELMLRCAVETESFRFPERVAAVPASRTATLRVGKGVEREELQASETG